MQTQRAVVVLVAAAALVAIPGAAFADIGGGESGTSSCVGVQTVSVTARYIGGIGHYDELYPEQYGDSTKDVFDNGVFGEMCGEYHPPGQQ